MMAQGVAFRSYIFGVAPRDHRVQTPSEHVNRVEAVKRLLSLGRGSPVSGGIATVLSTRLHS